MTAILTQNKSPAVTDSAIRPRTAIIQRVQVDDNPARQLNAGQNKDTARCTLVQSGRFFSFFQKEDRTEQQRSVIKGR
jgi:copper oxidase (laccase) domain-containing protein